MPNERIAAEPGVLVAAPGSLTVPPGSLTVPPGADSSGGGGLAEEVRPRWRFVAIAAVGCIVAGAALFAALPRPHADAVKVVDDQPTITRAERLAGFPIYSPVGLPAGWKSDSVRFDHGTTSSHLHIGYLAPDLGYAGIEQSNTKRLRVYVSQMSSGGRLTDVVTINGVAWSDLVSFRNGTHDALVWYGPDSTIVIAGTTSLANLEQLAASLQVP